MKFIGNEQSCSYEDEDVRRKEKAVMKCFVFSLNNRSLYIQVLGIKKGKLQLITKGYILL